MKKLKIGRWHLPTVVFLLLTASGPVLPASAQSPPAATPDEMAWARGGQPASPDARYALASQLEYDALVQEQPESRPVPPDPAYQLPLSSRPGPFEITPETPYAGNSQNFFSGNAPVQDLSRLSPGNFMNTKYKWYGFVRLDGIFDFNPIRSTDSFVTSSIPVPQGRGQNAVLTPRYTRLGFDTETPWDDMGWDIKTRIELDFFNGNTSGAFGSFPLRLRFAWVDFGPFLIGQAASLFMDYDAYPNVLDYQGPPGMVLMRQPIFAVRLADNECWKSTVGVEQPYSDIQWFDGADWIVNPGTGIIDEPGVDRNVQDMPDFTGNVRRQWDYGHMQVAGIARKLTFQPAAGPDQNELGYGVNFTGAWHPWAHYHGCEMGEEQSPLAKSRILAQFATGRGINRYFNDINGLGLDATFDPANGVEPISSHGWYLTYEHWWADNWISNFCYSEANCNLTDTLPGNTYESANYFTANLIWLPVERMGVGVEYLYGTRENRNGESGTAHRFQMGFQYKF